LLAGLIFFGGWYFVVAFSNYGQSIERRALLATMDAAVASLDLAEVASLGGNADDLSSPQFADVRTRLKRIRDEVDNSRFAYLMALRNDDVVFLADAEAPDSPDYSPPGQVYTEATPLLRRVFVDGKPATEGPVSDRWGRWVSSLTPLQDPTTGRVIAILGVDISAEAWDSSVAHFRWVGVGVSGFLATVVVLFSYLVSRERRLGEKLVTASRHDGLTGLPNRKVFMEAVQRAMESKEPNFAVLYLDLDHFKDVNDTLGHPVGDVLLCLVAERLQSKVKQSDMVARFGGDEFAVIVTGVSESVLIERVAAELVAAMGSPFSVQGNTVVPGVSIGIATYEPSDIDAEVLLSHADVALYCAKCDGRGRYRFFTAAMDEDVRSRVLMSSELRQAIASDQLFLCFQPQFEIETSRLIGLEALVRWRHPERGVLAPREFIPVAENTGLIVPLGRWVLREACRQGKAWLDAGGLSVSIAVNVSAWQFKMAHELEQDIASSLASSGFPAESLELELTETGLMEASLEHRDCLSRLRKTGIRFAIDDFGTGYSSLDYLRRYPADRVKIAQEFVKSVSVDPESAVIVKAIIGLSQDLGMVAIAEGVETGEQLELLKAWGCREAQGYYFARPLPPQEAWSLLQQRSAPQTESMAA
jgi:diguanylate cyclase (GGDEF)-like protein